MVCKISTVSTKQLEKELIKRKKKEKELNINSPKMIKNKKLTPLKNLCKDYHLFCRSEEYCEDNDYADYFMETCLSTFYGDNFWKWHKQITER